jgi:hypothetical protein
MGGGPVESLEVDEGLCSDYIIQKGTGLSEEKLQRK